PVNEFRRECREFAEHWIGVQREEFKRLGVEGDWEHYYSTMAYTAEATIASELMKFALNGALFRGSKPVMWSVVEKTALAEAEIEYHDYTSDTVWVKFPVVKREFSGAAKVYDARELAEFEKLAAYNPSVVIWTTTPWTLPGNRAISFNSKIEYGLYEVTKAQDGNWAKPGDKLILAKKLAAAVMKSAKVEKYEQLADAKAEALRLVVTAHPLKDVGGDYDF